VTKRSENPQVAALALMAIVETVALGLAAYLLWLALAGGISPVGCGSGAVGDCNHVLASRWSRWLHMPVTLPALLLYAALLAATLSAGPWAPVRLRRIAWPVVVTLVTLATGCAVWFIALQLLVIGAVCAFCMTAHACAIVLMGTVLHQELHRPSKPLAPIVTSLGRAFEPSRAAGQDDGPLPRSVLRYAVPTGLAGVAVMILLQVLVAAPQFTVTADLAPTADVLPVTAQEPELQPPAGGQLRPSPEASDAPLETHLARDSGRNPVPRPDERPDGNSPGGARADADEDTGRAPDTAGHTVPADRSELPPTDRSEADRTELIAAGTGPDEAAPIPAQAAAEPPAEPPGGPPAVAEAKPPRTVKILGGKIKLRVDEQVVLGDATAGKYVVELFDYTCPHCRKMHFQLRAARQRYGLGIILIPTPLNPGCNPAVKNTQQSHVFACMYARLALAVWKHNRAAFPEFHDWLFESIHPPPSGIARSRAHKLIPNRQLFDAVSDPWVDDHLAKCVRIYRLYRAGAIPKVVIGTRLLTGSFDSENELFKMVERSLGVTPLAQHSRLPN